MSVTFSFDRLPLLGLAAALFAAGWLTPETGRSQPPEGTEIGSLFPTERSAEASEIAAEALPSEGIPEDQSIAPWLDGLGAGRFAARERAAGKLLEIGPAALPALRRLEQTSDDPEVRLRAGELARQLSRGNLEARVEAFLAGEQVGFEGWNVARSILGESPSVRQLFVEMLRSHPQLVASLAGTPRDRTAAMEGVMVQVQRGMLFEQRLPNAANAFALLLPVNDPNVPMSHAYEDAVLSVLRQAAVNQLNDDPQLSGPFRALVGGWVRRTSLSNRPDVLLYALNWKIPEARPLAVETLSQTREVETLVFALQTIAQFGDPEDAQAVVSLLDDARATGQPGFAGDEILQTQVRDAAMATIAILHEVPLVAAGFPRAAEHEKYGFVAEDLGFPADEDEARQATRKKIDQILAGQQVGS